MMRRTLLKIFFCAFWAASLFADHGSWSPSWVDTYWDNNANWTGSSFPNGPSEIAAFIGSQPGTASIDSNEDITIGTLHLDEPGNSITIGFSNNVLTFDDSASYVNQASIFLSPGQSHYINTPIELASDLSVYAGPESSLDFNQSINGYASVSILADPSTHINFNTENSYMGTTTVESGFLNVNGPEFVQNIPGDITVLENGHIEHGYSAYFNYSPYATMTMKGGRVDLGSTAQGLGSVVMSDNAFLEGTFGSALVLTDPNTSLVLKGNSVAILDYIYIVNGGAITNSTSLLGKGMILGAWASQGTTYIDLNGNVVSINADQSAIPESDNTDLEFYNVQFVNGSLIKNGAGKIVVEGDQNNLPSLAIYDGTLQLGRSYNPSYVSLSGFLAVLEGSVLNGVGSLMQNGRAAVINSGTVMPGEAMGMGSFTIYGDYKQTASGNLAIQGYDAYSINTLSVYNGSVTLDGTFSFNPLPGSFFFDGDSFVVLDNFGGSISGMFSSTNINLPEGLYGALVYTNDQVIMEIFSL